MNSQEFSHRGIEAQHNRKKHIELLPKLLYVLLEGRFKGKVTKKSGFASVFRGSLTLSCLTVWNTNCKATRLKFIAPDFHLFIALSIMIALLHHLSNDFSFGCKSIQSNISNLSLYPRSVDLSISNYLISALS